MANAPLLPVQDKRLKDSTLKDKDDTRFKS